MNVRWLPLQALLIVNGIYVIRRYWRSYADSTNASDDSSQRRNRAIRDRLLCIAVLFLTGLLSVFNAVVWSGPKWLSYGFGAVAVLAAVGIVQSTSTVVYESGRRRRRDE